MYAPSPEKIKVIKELSRKEIVFALARKPKTGHIFFGGSDFTVWDLDLDKDKPEPKELGRHESYVTGLALAGTTLVSGGYDGRLIWWDTESGSKVRSVDAHRKWIRCLAATPDGKVLASVADDMVCRLWDVASGRLIHELHGHEEKTPHRLLLDALRLRDLVRRPSPGDRRQGRPRQHLGPRIRPEPRQGRGAGVLHLGPGPASALDRRDPRPRLLARRGATRRRRHRQDRQHRPSGGQAPGGAVRLAEGPADLRVLR